MMMGVLLDLGVGWRVCALGNRHMCQGGDFGWGFKHMAHLQCPTAAMTQLSNASLAAVTEIEKQFKRRRRRRAVVKYIGE